MTASTQFTRKNIRLTPANYVGKRTYFVTICCQSRKPALANSQTAARCVELLRDCANQMKFAIHAYCLMPDHLHILADGLADDSRLVDFVHTFKQRTAFEHQQNQASALWQFKFYDHILRSGANAEAVCWYIWLNPVRAGICRVAGEYEFSGSFTQQGAELLKAAPATGWTPPWKKSARPL
jgi:putative transposase